MSKIIYIVLFNFLNFTKIYLFQLYTLISNQTNYFENNNDNNINQNDWNTDNWGNFNEKNDNKN